MSAEPKAGCFIAILDGVVRGAVASDDPKDVRKAIAEWTRKAPIPDIARVPVAVARKFLFQPWPGLFEATNACSALPPLPTAEETQ